MIAIYIFKNGITFFVETALNVISLILYQRRLSQKRRLHTNSVTTRTHKTLNQTETQGIASIQPGSIAAIEQNNDTAEVSTSAGGRNMANLVLTQTISSFIHDTLLLSYTLFILINPKPGLTSKVLQFVSAFATAVRHAANFLQFYFFNSKFRNEIHIATHRVAQQQQSAHVSVQNL
jgi:hypothetical protein